MSRALIALLLGSVALFAKEDPVQWSIHEKSPGLLAIDATIAPGWHLYSPTTPPGGPIVTKIGLSDNGALQDWTIYRPQPVRKLDTNFNIDTETYTGSAEFLVTWKAAANAPAQIPILGSARYQACSNVSCLPPVTKNFQTTVLPSDGAAGAALPADYIAIPKWSVKAAKVEFKITEAKPAQAQPDWLPYLLTAFGAGLLALFTPCVFPMIPITVSYFLNQGGETQKRSLTQPILFCLGIIVLFTGLGFLVTAIAGPFGVVQLGSSPYVNGFITLVFLIFGLSLLGAFELRLPSGLLTKLDRASQGGGVTGTLIMGLTFSLTSFACIGPIVGPILIASVQTKGALPVFGMLAFATGLALPFFVLALFPSFLQALPRSGGWMARVKIVLGFVVLAIMLKYLTNVDQVLQLHWLTRERFLAAWVVLFALPGLYLLGFLRLEGIKKDEPLGVARVLISALFLIFAISLIPGLFGARLGDLDAFVPEPDQSTTIAGTNAAASKVFKNDLDGALAAARTENKLVLVDFTGYACTNCHWMKANMFTRPEIAAAVNNMVVAELYTDGADAASEKNQNFEDQHFHTVAIPFYAIMTPDGTVVAQFPQLTRNSQEFLAFLQTKPKQGA